MVQINVSQLLKAPIGSVRNYQINDIVNIADDDCLVQGEVRLMRTNRSIIVNGRLRTEIERTCSRCLNLFSCPLTLNIEEEYFPTMDVVTGSPLSLPDEPGCFTIDENNILDLTEAIRQYALLAIPMKPLCHQDCIGLCLTCGSNLNQAPCHCPPQPADSRWAELTKLVLADSKTPLNE
ncbi:MAG: DUF177 domain-containing protein [Chloroflexi bacterium]|nr:DUF177 domain-containing protein [Chloroflexota bacterium]MBI3040590.1 DUF177 domain-containing protein [Chloroflexota bacterium]MBI3930524.1 DUF177 domain-containing protein [Chloroflexota bacterium]